MTPGDLVVYVDTAALGGPLNIGVHVWGVYFLVTFLAQLREAAE